MNIFQGEGDDSEDQFTFWSLGNEYLEAATVLYLTPPTKCGYGSIVYYLLGHAAELYAKSYLNSQGVTIEDLKNKYRHNLEKLIKGCVGLGFDSDELEAILHLSKVYNAKELEYRRNKGQSYPQIDDLLSQVKKLGELSCARLTPLPKKISSNPL